jgi:hypothetical protein
MICVLYVCWNQIQASIFYGIIPLLEMLGAVGLRKLQKSSLGGPTFWHVMEEMCKTCTEEELRFFTRLARNLWFRRNDFLHGGPFMHPDILVQQVLMAMFDFSEANAMSRSVPQPKQGDKWKAPIQGWVKLNWDATLCLKHGLVGMGVVIRNGEGRVLAVRCSFTIGFLEPKTMKAWAGDHALQFG